MTSKDQSVPEGVVLPNAGLMRAIARGERLGGPLVRHVCPDGVMGALRQMPLTEIMQAMDFAKKTARVELYFDEQTHGVVHVHDGQIVRADANSEAGVWTGEHAFIELCRRPEGSFLIDYQRAAIERNIQRPTTFVLLEALRMLDEEKAGAGDETAQDAGFDEPWDEPAQLGGDTRSALEDASAIDIEIEAEPALQQHPRYRVDVMLEAILGEGEQRVACLLEDVGRGGAFVGTEAQLTRGDIIELFLLPGAAGPGLRARVVHVLDASAAATVARQAGVGVSFVDLPPEAAQALKHYVDELARQPGRQPITGGSTERERLLGCLAESEFLVAAGDLASAQRVLRQASGIAPFNDAVRRRLMKVNESIDAAQANALLERAARGGPNAVDMARRATQLRPARDVLLRSLGVFARAGAHDEIADVAEQLLELDPNDEGALRTLLDANVAMRRFTVAVQAAEALARLRPEDEQVRAQLHKVVQAARAGG